VSDQNLPPAAVIITQTVADFDAWKSVFDEHQPARQAAGMAGHHINRAEDDPNRVSVYMAITDEARARAFAGSDDLRDRMKDGGVMGPPEVEWMTPVREAIVWDRELPAFMLSHRVADVDRWLEGYDAAGTIQQEGGIIGHAANRSIDDPSLVVVYHQAESFDTLRAFLERDDLKTAMQGAGVISAPDVTFCTGGWAARYA
jgi:hypothetical protein